MLGMAPQGLTVIFGFHLGDEKLVCRMLDGDFLTGLLDDRTGAEQGEHSDGDGLAHGPLPFRRDGRRKD